VAEGAPRRFVISCNHCGRQLMTVDRIRDPEISILEGHLRACFGSEPLGEAAPLDSLRRQAAAWNFAATKLVRVESIP